jgi:hypothetical protein
MGAKNKNEKRQKFLGFFLTPSKTVQKTKKMKNGPAFFAERGLLVGF